MEGERAIRVRLKPWEHLGEIDEARWGGRGAVAREAIGEGEGGTRAVTLRGAQASARARTEQRDEEGGMARVLRRNVALDGSWMRIRRSI